MHCCTVQMSDKHNRYYTAVLMIYYRFGLQRSSRDLKNQIVISEIRCSRMTKKLPMSYIKPTKYMARNRFVRNIIIYGIVISRFYLYLLSTVADAGTARHQPTKYPNTSTKTCFSCAFPVRFVYT
jgi:hypothetical protein